MSKSRNWSMILYPESLPENWQDIIADWGFPMAISPLHDADKNDDGTLKKPHYHAILIYSNTTTEKSIKTLTDALNQPKPQACMTVLGAYEYFTHKNSPTKHQYCEEDIKVINGFSILNYQRPTRQNSIDQMKETLSIIRGNNLTSFADLVEFLLDSGNVTLLEYVQANSYFVGSYIKSRKERTT